MKIKILKDIPGYKAGDVIEEKGHIISCQTQPLVEKFWKDKFVYDGFFLIANGWAEEVKDEIDIGEIRKSLNAWNTYPYKMNNLNKDEQEWFTAYRIVKAVIEKLNGDWKPDYTSEANSKYEIYYGHGPHEIKGFHIEYQKLRTYQQIPICKDQASAEKVISLCEPELKILFGVK